MTHHDPSIDVAAIVDALHTRIAQHATTSQALVDTQAELADVHDALHEMELTRVISAHLPIVNTTLIGRVIGIIQKVTRRLLRWYINPIVEQQNMYNDAVIRTIRELISVYESTTHPTPPAVTPSMPTSVTAENAPAVQQQLAQSEAPISAHTLELLRLDGERQRHQHVHAHWPLPVNSPTDQIANSIHKLQRLGLRWYINPIVDQMNAFNRAAHRTLQLLVHYVTAKRLPPRHHES